MSIIEIDILASHLVLFKDHLEFFVSKIRTLPFERSKSVAPEALVREEPSYYFASTTFETEKILINILSEHLE